MGVISSLGRGVPDTENALRNNVRGIRPLSLFSTSPKPPLPVGEVPPRIVTDASPRTHQLALIATAEAMAKCREAPDAVILGTTTGGMLTTEGLLKDKASDPALFRYHGAGSVAEEIARLFRCTGPVVTISTACSSGTVAIKVALDMLRAGLAERVLTGGADSLCRLTYFGFNALQLIDPEGARPLDKNRRGISVAEGAAILLLTTDPPDDAVAEVLGAGLSCDAYHPVAPHPGGRGAVLAIEAAIRDAGISPSDIGYINLHGTGTPDNDLSEARAIRSLFPGKKPLLSSVKGAFGHALGASGAIEAVVSALALSTRLVPANTGCRSPDPDLELEPIKEPSVLSTDCVLSNSFGFGGNNAAVIFGTPGKFNGGTSSIKIDPLEILGCACWTGAGDTRKTFENLSNGTSCSGMLSIQKISENLSPRIVRRLKRLPRLALSLAVEAHADSSPAEAPTAVFFGTGWGALSETHDFLARLLGSDEPFPSPTDFVGSVHSAPGSQIAMMFQSTGPNITTTGGDYSFEQSLMAAQFMSRDIRGSFFVVGADESHPMLSRLFDGSASSDSIPSDGGGAFCLKRGGSARGLYINLSFYENVENNPGVIASLLNRLGGPEKVNAAYGVILAGIPGACRDEGEKQLKSLLALSGYGNAVIDYRKMVGEFASASAVAAVMAVKFLEAGKLPEPYSYERTLSLDGKGALIIGFGKFITAMEVFNR
jgi:3-oxoacyl-(acyl-carrier-protein) synthase